jgi:hypothetical protein
MFGGRSTSAVASSSSIPFDYHKEHDYLLVPRRGIEPP